MRKIAIFYYKTFGDIFSNLMLRKQNLSSSEEKMLAKIHNCPGEKYQRRKIQSAKSRSNMRPIFEISRRSENDLKKNGVKTLQSIKKTLPIKTRLSC